MNYEGEGMQESRHALCHLMHACVLCVYVPAYLEYEIDVEGTANTIDEAVLLLLRSSAPQTRSRISLLREVLEVPSYKGRVTHHPPGTGVGLKRKGWH
jgi:hypothetical protein